MQASPNTWSDCPRSFVADERGAIAILGAVLIVVFIALAALTVDAGYLVHIDRRLQAATDSAALAASFDPARAAEIARASLDDNGLVEAEIVSVEVGAYSDDPGLAPAARFASGPPEDAVRITTRFPAPVFFAKSILGATTLTLSSNATAQQLPIAAFAALSDIASLDAGEISSDLSTVNGTVLSLSSAELDALGQVRLDLVTFAVGLAALEGTPGTSVGSVLSATVGLATLAQALHDALAVTAGTPLSGTEFTALEALDRIAQTASNSSPVSAADVVELTVYAARTASSLAGAAPTGTGVRPVDALIAFLQASSGDQQLVLSENVPVPGVGGVAVDVLMGRPSILGMSRTPIAAAGRIGTTIYSATGRARLSLAVNVAGYGANIPLMIDLGYGQATLSSITCGPDIASTTDIGITAQSGVARLFLGNVSNGQFQNLSALPTPTSASIINAPPLLTVSGTATSALPTGQETLHFSRADIENGVVKSVGAVNPQLAANELANGLTFGGILGPTLSPTLRPLIAALIQAAATALPPALEANGLRLGTLDVTATSARCGLPVLVN